LSDEDFHQAVDDALASYESGNFESEFTASVRNLLERRNTMATVKSNKEIKTLKGTQISFQRVPPAFLKKKLAEQKEKEATLIEQATKTPAPTSR